MKQAKLISNGTETYAILGKQGPQGPQGPEYDDTEIRGLIGNKVDKSDMYKSIAEEIKKSKPMIYDITNIMSLYQSYNMEYMNTSSSNTRTFECVDQSNAIPFEPGKYVIYYSGSIAEGNNSVGGSLRAGMKKPGENYPTTEGASFLMAGASVGKHIEIYDTFEVTTTKSLYPVMFVHGAGATQQTFHIVFDKIYIVNITNMELEDCIETIRKNTMSDKIEYSVVDAIKDVSANFTEKLLENDKKIDGVSKITEEVKKSSIVYDITNIMSLFPSYNMEYMNTSSSNTRTFDCVDPSNAIQFEPGKYVIYYSGSTAEGSKSTNGSLRAGMKKPGENYPTTEGVSFPMTSIGVGKRIEIYDTFEVKTTTKTLYPVMFIYGAGNTEQTFHIKFDKIYIVNITNMELEDCIRLIQKNPMSDKIEYSVVDAAKDALSYCEPTKRVVCWGDSLTYGSGANVNGGVPYPDCLKNLLGEKWTVVNMGVGGEDAPTILGRQGGIPYIVQPGVTIPASASSKVQVTIKSEYEGKIVAPLKQGDSKMINPCYVKGVKCKLTIGSDKTTYYLQRAEDGEEVVINRPVSLVGSHWAEKCDVSIFFVGQNGSKTPAELVAMIKRGIDHTGSNKYLVLGLTTGDNEGKKALDTAQYEAFGRHFINSRVYMTTPIYEENGSTIKSCYVLDDYGLVPTDEDKTYIGLGKVPPSVLYDSVHGNKYYYDCLSKLVYTRGKELGYW